MIDCSGDECSLRGDALFGHDLGGIEFSIFYDDRARNLWNPPSGLMIQMPGVKLLLEAVSFVATAARRQHTLDTRS